MVFLNYFLNPYQQLFMTTSFLFPCILSILLALSDYHSSTGSLWFQTLKEFSVFLWDDSSDRANGIHIQICNCNLTSDTFFWFYFPILDFNITFPKLHLLTFNDYHLLVTSSSIHFKSLRLIIPSTYGWGEIEHMY